MQHAHCWKTLRSHVPPRIRMKTPSKGKVPTSLTDPVHFAADVLGSVLWRRQRDIMRAVATKPLVAVKACHASGKTYLAARFALWWLLRYPEGKVINTAPGWRQVRLMWDEIRLAASQSRIEFPVPSATELRISDANYIQGISTNEAVNVIGVADAQLGCARNRKLNTRL